MFSTICQQAHVSWNLAVPAFSQASVSETTHHVFCHLSFAQAAETATVTPLTPAVPLPVSAETNTAPTDTTAPASRVLSADEGTSDSTGGTGAPVVVVMCTAADMSPQDLITPWSQAVVAAGVPHVMLVSDDAGCVAAAKAAGIKVLQHTFQVRTVKIVRKLVSTPVNHHWRNKADRGVHV